MSVIDGNKSNPASSIHMLVWQGECVMSFRKVCDVVGVFIARSSCDHRVGVGRSAIGPEEDATMVKQELTQRKEVLQRPSESLFDI